MKFRSLVAAALLAVGFGSAANAATIIGWNNWYNPPVPIYAGAYDVDLYLEDGEHDGEAIASWGDFNKETPVAMRIYAEWFEPDYWADVSVSSQGRDWDMLGSLLDMHTGGFFGGGYSPDGGTFEFLFMPANLAASYLSINYLRGPELSWIRLSFDNVQAAPIPLPATAALLPLGLGALAMMRKRRRAVS